MNPIRRGFEILRREGPRSLVAKVSRAVRRSIRILRTDGVGAVSMRAARKIQSGLVTQRISMLVEAQDAVAVDWTVIPDHHQNPPTVESGSVEIAWLMSPPGKESGGHQNLFRFIDFAERAGHRCTIYLYHAAGTPELLDLREMLKQTDAYAKVSAEIKIYDREVGVDSSTQAIFATGWETAYPVFLDRTEARRFYFIQDFEASFYPLGSESLLAENTYRFGFHGISAGGWLAKKLHDDYGMQMDHFDFAVDKSRYHLTNLGARHEVFFYARPVTSRRAFEFGLLVLEEFAKLEPDVVINLAGWDVSNWEIPFTYNNLASLEISQLNEVYNRCAAGLVLSLSNMSLLPLELISSGVAPVVNDAPNNRLVSDNPNIEYVPLSPRRIAQRMAEVLRREDSVERSIAMSASVAKIDWEDSGTQFNDAFERAMRG